MNSVLQSPTLPMLAVIEERFEAMEARIKKLEEENAEIRTDLLETKEFLALSLKRNTQLENAIFSHDDEGELVKDDNDKPVLSQTLTTNTEKPIEAELEVTPIIETTKDRKACAIVGYLQNEVKPNDFGAFVIDRKELDTFMTAIIEEGLRVKKVSRQLKADLFEIAVKLFPGIVYIQKSKSGNKTKMLTLKPSVKSPDTYAMTRTAPLGIWA